jgi:hypothetical protein
MDIPLETILSTINNVILVVIVVVALIKGKNMINVRPLIEKINTNLNENTNLTR